MEADSKPMTTSRDLAEQWAKWFAALGDANRILIVQLLASAPEPMSVGEITNRLAIGQSTVSHHLAKLSEVGFVLVDRVGTSTLWRVNDHCLQLFPQAAEAVMGHPVSPQSARCPDNRQGRR